MGEKIIVTGGSGFVGRHLIPILLQRGHVVQAVVRPSSLAHLPSGCVPVEADPLDAETYSHYLTRDHIFIQLVGALHPKPWQKNLFEEVDGRSGREAVRAAQTAHTKYFVYVSVAHPAPVMQSYIRVRQAVEEKISQAHLDATILRPWYILGPGRRWPLLLKPLYWIFENQIATRASAQRLGFVSIRQMVTAIVEAVENRQPGIRVWEVPQIRESATKGK